MCQARFLQCRAGCIPAVTIWTGTEVRTQRDGGMKWRMHGGREEGGRHQCREIREGRKMVTIYRRRGGKMEGGQGRLGRD